MFVGGIEGGATHSNLVIFNEHGEAVAAVPGPGTNHWMCGIPECASRIAKMVLQGKLAANIPENVKLKALGLSLSGCEQEATNKELESELHKVHSNTSESYVICSDTVGSIFTATNLGGIVLIAGTGSNAFLRNPSGTTAQCGGWGHILGDEGGAWWIAHRAIKIIFDHEDNLKPSPLSIGVAWQKVKEHFQIETRPDLLDHCYAKFDKSFFARLCKKLADAAIEGDALCEQVFKDAGFVLGKSMLALLPKVEDELVSKGMLTVACVGSVWESWKLLKPGFINALNTVEIPYEIQLVRLTKSMANGAAYLAADSVDYHLKRSYAANVKIFFTYEPLSANKTKN